MWTSHTACLIVTCGACAVRRPFVRSFASPFTNSRSCDLASLVFVTLVARHVGLPIAIGAALEAALAVGLFNGMLIASFGVEPFLATLGTLFIGQSIQ